MPQTFYKPISQINMAPPATNLLSPPPPLPFMYSAPQQTNTTPPSSAPPHPPTNLLCHNREAEPPPSSSPSSTLYYIQYSSSIFQFPEKHPLPPANSQPLLPFPPTPNWIIYYLYIVLTFINIKWKEYGIQQKEYSIQRNGNSAWWGRGVPEIVSAQVVEWAYGPDKQIQVRIPETSSMSPGLAWVVFTLQYIKDFQTTPSMTLINVYSEICVPLNNFDCVS